MNLQGKKINFLGDSITEGCGTSGGPALFTSLIAEQTGAICRNYGIGGTRIARQHTPSEEAAWDRDYCSRVAEMDPDADIVVIFGGTNDYGHGDAPIGSPSDRTPDTFYGALHTLYTSLIEKYPEAVIVILTPLHRCVEEDPRGEGRRTQAIGTLKEYVNIIREVAEFYSLPVIDLYANSGLQPRVPVIKEKYMPDGLHPNDAGHRILALKIAHFLENM